MKEHQQILKLVFQQKKFDEDQGIYWYTDSRVYPQKLLINYKGKNSNKNLARTTLSKSLKKNTTSNRQIPVIFLTRIQNHLWGAPAKQTQIESKYEKTSHKLKLLSFYKIIDLYSSQIQDYGRQRKAEELCQVKGD